MIEILKMARFNIIPLIRKLSDKFFSIICIISFITQSIILFDEYMQGKSVVNIAIGQTFNDHLPALTICPASGLLIDRLSRLNPEYMELYREHQFLLKNKTSFVKANKFHYDVSQKVFIDLKNGNSSMDIYDLMKNYTDQFLNHINQSKIDIKILSKASTLAHSVPNIINISLQPIESITINWMLSKCFTFFSHLQEVWRKSKFDNYQNGQQYIPKQYLSVHFHHAFAE